MVYGSAGGFTTFVSNTAGPIMNTYLVRLGLDKHEMIGTSAWFYFVVNVTKVPVYLALGAWSAGGHFFTAESLAYDLVLVFHYLHRPLFPALVRALAPGGLLLYETFTAEQALRGKPKNPDFLLEPGELRKSVASLVVLREREGEFEGRMVAGVAARKPKDGS